MIKTVRQAVHTWYHLSCGHVARSLSQARGNTTHCWLCAVNGDWPRVFIIATVYEKPLDND